MSKILGLVQVMFVAIAALACSDDRGDDDAGEGGVPMATLDAFDAMVYFELLDGNFSLPFLDSQLDPITAEDWRRTVARQRAEGFDALSKDERELLLRAGLRVYFQEVSGAERHIDVKGEGTSTISERYAEVEGLFLVLKEREERSSGIVTGWGDLVTIESGDHCNVAFYDQLNEEDTVEAWTCTDEATPRCERLTDLGGVGLASSFYYQTLAQYLETSESVGEQSVQGREFAVMQMPYGDSLAKVWVDSFSLIPVRFGFPELQDGEGRQLQPAKSVTITAVNPAATITRPTGTCSDSS